MIYQRCTCLRRNPVREPERSSQRRSVGLQAGDEAVGVGEGGEVAAGHLVGGDPEAVPHDAALEVGGEEAVVAAEQEPGGDIRPGIEGPWLLERGARLLP